MIRSLLVCLAGTAYILAAASTASCTAAPLPAADENTAAPLSQAALTAPTVLNDLPAPSRSVSAAGLWCAGADYEAQPLSRVSRHPVNLDSALYSPAWTSPANLLNDAALAVYSFNLLGYSGEAALTCRWDTPPAASQGWLGLSDWAAKCWRWYAMPEGGALTLDGAGFAPFTRGDGELRVAVVVTGTADAALRWLSIGPAPETWERSWGGAADDQANAVYVDSAGYIYIAGQTQSFGEGLFDMALLKLDSAGSVMWRYSWGNDSQDSAQDAAVDSTGAVYFIGQSDGDLTLLKFTPAGVLEWAKRWGTLAGLDSGISLVIDEEDKLYCAGSTNSFGEGLSDTLLLKADSAGVVSWAKTWGGGSHESIQDLALAPGVGLYAAGYSQSFGAGNWDAFVLHYDPADGALQWDRLWGGGEAEYSYSLAVDEVGHAFMAGSTESFGLEALLLIYDSDGDLLTSITGGGDATDRATAVSYSSSVIHLAGTSTGFGAVVQDIFLVEYSTGGVLLGSRLWGGVAESGCFGLALTAAGRAVLTGSAPFVHDGSDPFGEWREDTCTFNVTAGTETADVGSAGDAAGTFTDADGVLTANSGVIDTGGGGDDLLVLSTAY